MMIALPKPQLLDIAGADAVNFAHAQFSNDVRSLANGRWQWNAWLSPQGRVRALFHLLREGDEHLRVLLRGGNANELRAALAPYVLRARVTLSAIDDVLAYGECGDAPASASFALTCEPDSTAFDLAGTARRRIILRRGASVAAPDTIGPDESWRLADIRDGLPDLAPVLADQMLPQWLGLDRLDAVSVRKGCYPGQEVMSRLHFKGGNKRSLYRLELASTEAPEPGTAVHTGSNEHAGQLVMAARDCDGHVEALASLADAAAGEPLQTREPVIRCTVRERFAAGA